MTATTLQSSRNSQNTPCFAVTPQQTLVVVDGINGGRRWNGVLGSTTALGITAPTSAATTTAAATGGAETGDYVIYYRYKDADSNYSSLSPVKTLTMTAGQKFSHAGLVASSDTNRVTHVELYRSLVNASDVLYLVTTLSNGTTTYNDTLTDSDLSANTSLVIDNPDGSTNANRFDPPPTTRLCCEFFDRIFYAGRVTYSWGSVELTNGSASVVGRGTAWTDQMVGWKFYVPSHTTEYTVSAVGSATSITLTAVFSGTTNLFSSYALRADKSLRRRIYYSSVLEPESVRATDYVLPADDGDDWTAMYAHRSQLFIAEGTRTWRLFIAAMQGRESQNTKPGVGLQHAVYRGAVNHRCIAQQDEIVYVMDRDGVYAFDGSGVKDLSAPIQDFFRYDRINWNAAETFFASQDNETVIFHVALGDGYLPHFALVYHTPAERWECIEDYPWRLGCSTQAYMANRWTAIYGGEAGKFYLKEGTLDGPTERTIRGTATSATLLTLVDTSSDAVLPSAAVGCSLVITAGAGKGQRRRIVAISSGTMTIDQPWYELPDTTSEYQVGGVTWNAKTGIYQLPAQPAKGARQIAVVAEPTSDSASLDVRRYLDHATTPDAYVVDQNLGLGVSITKNSPDAVMDLKRVQTNGVFSGRRHWELDGYTHGRLDGGRFVQVELRGVQGMDRVKVYNLTLHGLTTEIE